MKSPASEFFIPAMRGGRIAIAATKSITDKVRKGLAARKAAKVAAKKAAEARVRAQERARAEREERRKMLSEFKKKRGEMKKMRDEIDKPLADAKKRKMIKVMTTKKMPKREAKCVHTFLGSTFLEGIC